MLKNDLIIDTVKKDISNMILSAIDNIPKTPEGIEFIYRNLSFFKEAMECKFYIKLISRVNRKYRGKAKKIPYNIKFRRIIVSVWYVGDIKFKNDPIGKVVDDKVILNLDMDYKEIFRVYRKW